MGASLHTGKQPATVSFAAAVGTTAGLMTYWPIVGSQVVSHPATAGGALGGRAKLSTGGASSCAWAASLCAWAASLNVRRG